MRTIPKILHIEVLKARISGCQYIKYNFPHYLVISINGFHPNDAPEMPFPGWSYEYLGYFTFTKEVI